MTNLKYELPFFSLLPWLHTNLLSKWKLIFFGQGRICGWSFPLGKPRVWQQQEHPRGGRGGSPSCAAVFAASHFHCIHSLLCRRDVCWLFLLLLSVDRTITNHFKEKQSQLSNFSTSESEPFLSSSPNPSASADRTSPTMQCQGSCAIDLHNGILLSCSLCTLMFHPRF